MQPSKHKALTGFILGFSRDLQGWTNSPGAMIIVLGDRFLTTTGSTVRQMPFKPKVNSG